MKGKTILNMNYKDYNKMVNKLLRHLKKTKTTITKTEFKDITEDDITTPCHIIHYERLS